MPSDLKTSSNQFILALDQGTSSSRALVFNRRGEVVAQAHKPLTQHYPQPGWVRIPEPIDHPLQSLVTITSSQS